MSAIVFMLHIREERRTSCDLEAPRVDECAIAGRCRVYQTNAWPQKGVSNEGELHLGFASTTSQNISMHTSSEICESMYMSRIEDSEHELILTVKLIPTVHQWCCCRRNA